MILIICVAAQGTKLAGADDGSLHKQTLLIDDESHDVWQVPSRQNSCPFGHVGAKAVGQKSWLVTHKTGQTTLYWGNNGHWLPYLSWSLADVIC